MKKLRNQIIFFIIMIVIWEVTYQANIFPPLLFPSIVSIGKAFIASFIEEDMIGIIGYSLSLIGKGLLIGIVLGFFFSMLSILFQPINDIYSMVIAVCDPIPSIALLPLAILWCGTGEATILFIIVHSVIWPMSRNIIDGFAAVPKTYLEVGHNIGLNKRSILTGVYLPASFPYILSGFKVGWARAWRALISAEMIFGVSGKMGGLGWYIYKKRYQLETDYVFASLLIIIIIGMLIEYVVFAQIEKKTVKKWGMVR